MLEISLQGNPYRHDNVGNLHLQKFYIIRILVILKFTCDTTI